MTTLAPLPDPKLLQLFEVLYQCRSVTRAAEQGAKVVMLDVGIADAAKRIGFDKSRPLLSVNPRQSWIKTMEARRPTYESLADHRVDTAGRDVEAVVATLDQVVPEIVVTGTPEDIAKVTS